MYQELNFDHLHRRVSFWQNGSYIWQGAMTSLYKPSYKQNRCNFITWTMQLASMGPMIGTDSRYQIGTKHHNLSSSHLFIHSSLPSHIYKITQGVRVTDVTCFGHFFRDVDISIFWVEFNIGDWDTE